MTRENQGLQIALIVFVMLTIILGVTTFIFFRQYEETDTKAQAAQADANKHRMAASTIQEENNELKRLIGVAATKKLDEVTAQFNKDMQHYGGNFPEESRFYSPMLGYLFKTIEDKNIELSAVMDDLEKFRAEYEVREASKDPQIKKFEAAATEAGQELATVQSKAKSERDRITGDQTRIKTRYEKARKADAAARGALEEKLQQTSIHVQKLAQLNKQKADKLEAISKETFDVPDGEIRWVNQRNGTVWINLGRADSLSRQTTFSVYPADISNLTGGGKKASIEVTEILGEHLAEARVVEDKISDPIMPGDKIHTPVWSPGEQKRFALAGFMDIDDDGKSDQHIVRNLITMNGGVVDCETDAGGKRQGKMTVNTRYLVLGEAPDAKGRSGVIAGFTRMIGDAKRLGIQKISLAELLRNMGYKRGTRVIQFGRGANPNDFRAKPPDGVPKVSTGNVSDAFKPRRPPTRRSSAY